MYIRKTYDVYEIQGNYGYGWEEVTQEETYSLAKKQKRIYDLNENFPHRIVVRRIRKKG